LVAYEDAALTLHERDPTNQDWAMETFYASNNLGSLSIRRSRFETAQSYFEDAIARIDELIDQEPTADRLFERSTVLSWLGSTHVHRGNLTAARQAFRRALDGLTESECPL
jgi:tetratricopeptide (TPR) repeat protein